MNILDVEASIKLNIDDYEDNLKEAEKLADRFDLGDAKEQVDDLQESFDKVDLSDAEDEVDNFQNTVNDLDISDATDAMNDLQESAEDVDMSEVASEIEETQSAMDGLDSSNVVEQEAEIGGGADDAADQILGMVSTFDSGIGSMTSAIVSGGIMGAMSEIVGAVMNIGTEIVETVKEWEDAFNNMEIATGQAGDDLIELQNTAKATWAAIANDDGSIQDQTEIVSDLATAMGWTGEQAQEASVAFSEYEKITGDSSAVENVIQSLKTMHSLNGDYQHDTEVIVETLNKLTQAQSDALGTSGSDLTEYLSRNAGAFDELGWSLDDAIGQLDAYVQAGGSASDFSRVLFNFINNLPEGVENVGKAWEDMTNKLENGTDVYDTLQKKVKGTDKTIQDLIGKKFGQKAFNIFSNSSFYNVEKYTKSIENADTTLQTYYEDTKTTGDKISQQTNQMSFAVSTAWEAITEGEDAARDSMEKYFNSLGYQAGLNETDVNSLKEGIKNYFATGELIPVTKHASAMNSAEILRSPTIFGASGGSLHLGGEAGNEVISGESHLMDMIGEASGNEEIVALLSTISSGITKLLNKKTNMYINGNTLVGEIAPAMDRALGGM